MDRADSLPSVPGAYVLVLQLARPVTLRIATLPSAEIGPGCYAYVGNAHGPGGIRARVRRHLRPDKKIHWHIDHLTAVAAIQSVAAHPDRNECDVVSALREDAGLGVPIVGFGSSDCRNCEAHLVTLR